MAKSDKIRYILMIIVAVVGLWIFVDQMVNFSFPLHFYNRHPDMDRFIGSNVVSVWANFAFFTFITIILWCVWAFLYAFCHIVNINGNFLAFLEKDTVVSFVFMNYIMTAVLFTLFSVCSGDFTFGFTYYNPLRWHALGTNLLAHYVIFGFAIYSFIKVPTRCGCLNKAFISVGVFLTVYYLVVKLTGEFAYSIRWFPYVIFDAKSFGAMFGVANYAVSVVLLVVACLIIFVLYVLGYYLLIKYKRKQNAMLVV